MTQTASPELTGAPAYPMTRACPYQLRRLRALRERGPLTKVTLDDGRQVWLVSGNEVGRALFPDPRLSSDVLHPGFPVLAPRIAAQTQQRAAPPLVGVDDPEHGRQRRMVIPGFGIRRVAALRRRSSASPKGSSTRCSTGAAPPSCCPGTLSRCPPR
ncbi:hypothetical protein GCM10027072_33070 [Streptomyces bullii]